LCFIREAQLEIKAPKMIHPFFCVGYHGKINEMKIMGFFEVRRFLGSFEFGFAIFPNSDSHIIINQIFYQPKLGMKKNSQGLIQHISAVFLDIFLEKLNMRSDREKFPK
jgi:hypothetical protein